MNWTVRFNRKTRVTDVYDGSGRYAGSFRRTGDARRAVAAVNAAATPAAPADEPLAPVAVAVYIGRSGGRVSLGLGVADTPDPQMVADMTPAQARQAAAEITAEADALDPQLPEQGAFYLRVAGREIRFGIGSADGPCPELAVTMTPGEADVTADNLKRAADEARGVGRPDVRPVCPHPSTN